jgi:MFS family permease
MESPDAEAGKLTRTVVALGWVALLTDLSSELIFPLLPIFLTEVLGAPATFVGLLEGAADATASGVKYLSGRVADRASRLKPLVLLGYGISTFLRPLIALATHPWHVLAVRLTDRVGKGIRSPPRDVMVTRAAGRAARGKSFGFHQAMDDGGAALGTVLGSFLLYPHINLRQVFVIASLPGFAALAVLAATREPMRVSTPEKSKAAGSGPLPSVLYRYLAILFVFTAANSSDAFLILKVRQAGASQVVAPLLWLALNGVKSLLGTLGGGLSDRLGRVALLASGWVIYAVSYAAFSVTHSVLAIFGVTAFYGLYGALAQGAERALVADLCPRESHGAAFGAYYLVNGLGLLTAGLLFGQLWDRHGSADAFRSSAVLAGVATVTLVLAHRLGWLRPAEGHSQA